MPSLLVSLIGQCCKPASNELHCQWLGSHLKVDQSTCQQAQDAREPMPTAQLQDLFTLYPAGTTHAPVVLFMPRLPINVRDLELPALLHCWHTKQGRTSKLHACSDVAAVAAKSDFPPSLQPAKHQSGWLQHSQASTTGFADGLWKGPVCQTHWPGSYVAREKNHMQSGVLHTAKDLAWGFLWQCICKLTGTQAVPQPNSIAMLKATHLAHPNTPMSATHFYTLQCGAQQESRG